MLSSCKVETGTQSVTHFKTKLSGTHQRERKFILKKTTTNNTREMCTSTRDIWLVSLKRVLFKRISFSVDHRNSRDINIKLTEEEKNL